MIKILDMNQVSPQEIFARPEETRDVSGIVTEIIRQVQQSGDEALFRYARELDKAELTSLEVSSQELDAAAAALAPDFRAILEEAAENKGVTIQDYIRYKLFDLNTIFSVEEAVCRIQNGDYKGKIFTLPDVYGDQWTLERGMAGVFGKNFYIYVTNHTELGIRAKGYDKKVRREIYTYEGTN